MRTQPDHQRAAVAARLDRPNGRRAALLGALVLLVPVAAWFAAAAFGLMETSQALFAMAFPAVLFIGYQLWWLRILAIGSQMLGRRIGGGLWQLLVRRQSIEGRLEFMPTPEDIHELAERTLEATRVFRSVGYGAALVTGVLLGLMSGWIAGVVAAIALTAWGRRLASLGAAGWLFIPEAE